MSQNEKPFRWGVLGPGGIARKFATGLQVLPDHALLAVGSRSQERSDLFGDEFDVPRRYAAYEELVADPEIDAIDQDPTIGERDAQPPHVQRVPLARTRRRVDHRRRRYHRDSRRAPCQARGP